MALESYFLAVNLHQLLWIVGRTIVCNLSDAWAVVVAQLVERSLPIPEIRILNTVIGKNLFILYICFLSTVYWKDENRENEAVDGPFLKK